MNTELTLYEISDEIKVMEELIENAKDGEEKAVIALMEELHGLLQNKIDKVVGFYRYVKDKQAACKNRKLEIVKLEDYFDNIEEGLKKYVKLCMEKNGVSEIRGHLTRVMIPLPGEAVEVYDMNQLGQEFITTKKTQTPDKDEIKKVLKAGKDVPGARLVNAKTSVQFKNLKV